MAERRMFAKTIIDSDTFLAMPQSSQLLYFHLAMRAMDKGILNNTSSICRSVCLTFDDLSVLAKYGFIRQIDEKNISIVHWEENNGISETAHKRLSYKYRKWRECVLVRDNYTCQKCGYKGKVMNVHHIKCFADNQLLRYEINNGITLCECCHKAIHRKERVNGR